MVEDRVTDGRRIAQLLASELTGLGRDTLGTVSVVDADRDVEPSPAGGLAYRLERDGERLGRVLVHEEAATLELRTAATDGPSAVVDAADAAGLSSERRDGRLAVTVPFGAAVKRAVDVVASL